MLSPALLQASFQSLLIIKCLPICRLEVRVNKDGDIYPDGRLFKTNNVGLKAEWQGIMMFIVRLFFLFPPLLQSLRFAWLTISNLLNKMCFQ